MIYLVALVVSWACVSYPSFIIGDRQGVQRAWVALIPLVGPPIVWLWSIGRTGWLSLLGLIPFVNIVFSLWLIFAMPPHHGRTRWWGFAFLVLIVGIYYYAFTLPPRRVSALQRALDAD